MKTILIRFLCASALALVAGAALSSYFPARAQAPRSGKAVYDAHCVECHGASGRGDGESAGLLVPKPRDFTSGRYKIRSTESGSVPTDDDLIQSIGQGLYGTAMPAWRAILPDQEIRAVADYLKSLSPQFANPPKPVVLGPGVPSSPESVDRGRGVYDRMQCGKCHGTDGRGTGAVVREFQDDWKQTLRSADLTEPWTFHGGATARDVYLRFLTGMAGTPMPSFAGITTDRDMWDLANYVVSLARKPIWSMTASEVQAHYARQQAEAQADPVRRGEYLVSTLGCALCHSSYEGRNIRSGMRLAGGLLMRIEPFGDFTTGNLTSDKDTGLGNWSDDEIKRTITKGILRDGTRLLPFPMDWPSFSTMTPDDVDAIVKYLRTVPPVSNRIPRPKWKLLPSHLWGKFRMLMLGADPPMAYFSSAAGGQ